MATQSLSPGNDLRIITGGNLSIDLDGLGGTDTLDFGTQFQSYFTVTKSTDGAVHVDTFSGASEFFHATLRNFERLQFGDGTSIDLTTYFGPATPPPVTATLAPVNIGLFTGNIAYTLSFSESVTGLDASDFDVSNGRVLAVTGTGASYSVVVAPNAATESTLALTLHAGAVTGAAGGTLAAATTATTVVVDTKAPSLVAISPANQGFNVDVGSDIVLTFSEAIQKGAGTVTLKAGDTTVAVYDMATSPLISVSGSKLTINPVAALFTGTSYTVELSVGSVKDLPGNGLATALASNFITAGTLPSAVSFGTAGNNTLTGTGANNILLGGAGNDTIEGGGGLDTAIYTSKFSDYTLKLGAGVDAATTVQDKRVFGIEGSTNDGNDSLTHVQRLQFADQTLALDLGVNQAAGKTVLLMAATLGSFFPQNKSWAGIFLNFIDTSGATILDGANLLVSANIVSAFAGGTDNTSFVKFIYNNVNGVAPDAATLAPLVAALDNHSTTQGQWMADMAASKANQDHVNLVGFAQTGLAYVL